MQSKITVQPFLLIFFTFFFMLGLAYPSFAEVLPNPTPPSSFNFQGVLMDEAGNILSGKDTVDLTVGIKDTLGDFKFLEQHLGLPLINGAVSFLVGTGAPLEVDGEIKDLITALSPETGDKILVIQVSDQTIPQEEIFLSSVPYASYAGSVLSITNDSITTDSIANKAITYDDLSKDLTDWIEATAGTRSEEDASIEARSVTLENTFTNISGDNVQKGFEAIDAALNLGSSNIEAEATAREEADEALEDQIQTHIDTDINSAHPGEITSSTIADGTITTDDLAFSFTGWDTDASDDLTTSTSFGGDVSGTYDYLQLGSNSVGSSEITDGSITTDDLNTTDMDNRYVNTSGNETMTGDLTVGGDLTVNGTTIKTPCFITITTLFIENAWGGANSRCRVYDYCFHVPNFDVAHASILRYRDRGSFISYDMFSVVGRKLAENYMLIRVHAYGDMDFRVSGLGIGFTDSDSDICMSDLSDIVPAQTKTDDDLDYNEYSCDNYDPPEPDTSLCIGG